LDKLEIREVFSARNDGSLKSPINLVSPLEDIYDESVSIFKLISGD
jgi:hypothetical protein